MYVHVCAQIPGSLAACDGRLKPDDRVLEINSTDVMYGTQEQAAHIIQVCCPALLFYLSLFVPHHHPTHLFLFYFILFLYFCTALWFHPLLSQSWLLFFLHADYFPFHCQPPLLPPPPATANHRPHAPSLLPAINSFYLGDLLPTAKAVADRRVCD